MHIYTDTRLNALTYPLRVCFEQCLANAQVVRFELIDRHYELAREWLNAAVDYDQFCSMFPMWHRGRLDIAVADRLDTLFYASPPQGDSDLLREIVQYPHMLLGVSDGGAHTKFLTAGRYPTETLTHHVRDRGWLTYEEAHRRLSALPAQLAGFRDRGTIRDGGPADVIVYDPQALAIGPNHVVHDLPGGEWRRVQRATGYRAVLVNGCVTIENDEQTATYSGRLLRHGRG